MKCILNYLPSLFIISILSLFISCKKIDVNVSSDRDVDLYSYNRFFQSHNSSDIKESNIVAYLKNLQKRFDYIPTTVERIGYPRFDKIIEAKPGNYNQSISNSGNPDTIYIIPFARDSQNFVNASMILNVNGTDTTMSYRSDWQYDNFPNQINSSYESAESYSVFFMRQTQYVFGYSKFSILDSNLFKRNGIAAFEVSLDSQNISSVLQWVNTSCQAVTISWWDCGEAFSNIANTKGCLNTASYTYCEGHWVDDGIWPTFNNPPNTGGSGGGGGGGTPYTPPTCDPSPPIGNNIAAPPCGGDTSGGGGWIPMDPDDNLLYQQLSYLSATVGLSSIQIDWLQTHPTELNDIILFVTEGRSSINPTTNLPYNPQIDPYYAIAVKTALDARMSNILENGYNIEHFNQLKQNLPATFQQPNFDPMWAFMFAMECINLKMEHPEWSNFRIYTEASLQVIHILFDVAGMVPLIGEVADLANGVIYTIQGDGVNATLSFAATIPIGGWAATTAKYAKKLIIAIDGSKRTLKWIKTASGQINFGDRGLLRKILGLGVGDTRIAHHIIPWEHCEKGIIQRAAEADFHMNEILNGIPLTSIQHNGGHALYNSKVNDKLQNLLNNSNVFNWNDTQCANAVRNLSNQIRNWIVSHPNESINNIIIP